MAVTKTPKNSQTVLLWPPIMSISKASLYGFNICFKEEEEV